MSIVSPNEAPICPASLTVCVELGALVVIAAVPLPVVVILGTGIGSTGEVYVLRGTVAEELPVSVIKGTVDVLAVLNAV